MLCEAGVMGARDSAWERPQPATAADPAKAWAVFQRFAEEPVEGDELDPGGGDVGASYLVVDWHQGEGERFEQSFGRGFVFLDEDGEYSHSAILHCVFQYTPTPELRALGSQSFGTDEQPLGEWFAEVLSAPGFQIDDEPVGMKVWYSEV